MKKIRVIIVDDSAVVRQTLSKLISAEPDMEVVATAPDPFVARDKIVQLKPDVMTLDIEMPRMDGITFLSKVMHYFPIPTLIISSVTKKGCRTSMKALELGAMNVIPKPSEAYSIESIEPVLLHSIRSAARANIRQLGPRTPDKPPRRIHITTTNKILAIGASTGGTEALKNVMVRLPSNTPGTVIVQHMPPVFTAAYAERLNGICDMEVREAKDGDALRPGIALLAPGDFHMVLRRDGARYFVRVKKGPRIQHQRPAVDVLFKSVAEFASRNAVGVVLTGMGKDGAEGLKLMHDAKAHTICQDEATSVVWGMPKAAIDVGAADYVEPLDKVADRIQFLLAKK
ncbi:MAG: chemotaxis response regulator protein-glutamate methylesterase [Candidatus Cloacimonetes bacterium]|nr:chemotaxis response regulator protein-glutamate methylesterase [Candidatus Cloacimonadota bacterium]